MRFFAPLFALFATAVVAQSANNYINIPPGGLQVVAGQPTTITWQNPSSGTVTIKLQQGGNSGPNDGITVATGIQSSALTATFVIDGSLVNNAQYNFEIIDDTNPTNYNFSTGFTVQGATGTGVTATTTSSALSSISASLSSASSSVSASSSSASASASSASASSSHSSASSASAASSSASRTSSSSAAATSTSAPSSNGAIGMKLSSAFLAVAAGAVVAF